jgi:co-chaperonin GroES (HSP10)
MRALNHYVIIAPEAPALVTVSSETGLYTLMPFQPLHYAAGTVISVGNKAAETAPDIQPGKRVLYEYHPAFENFRVKDNDNTYIILPYYYILAAVL